MSITFNLFSRWIRPALRKEVDGFIEQQILIGHKVEELSFIMQLAPYVIKNDMGNPFVPFTTTGHLQFNQALKVHFQGIEDGVLQFKQNQALTDPLHDIANCFQQMAQWFSQTLHEIDALRPKYDFIVIKIQMTTLFSRPTGSLYTSTVSHESTLNSPSRVKQQATRVAAASSIPTGEPPKDHT